MSLGIERWIFGLILVGALPLIVMFSKKEVGENELKVISGVLADAPEYLRYNKNGPQMRLELENYKVEFVTNPYSQKALDVKEFKKNVEVGDTLFLKIKVLGANNSIENINEWMRDEVLIYELWDSNDKYLTVRNYNKHKSNDNVFLFIFWIIGMAFYFFKFWILPTGSAD